MLKTIYGARQSIRVMAYSFTSPAVAKALLEAKRRGVDVAVTVDYRNNVKAAAALGALAYAGVPVRVVRAFSMQHSKYVVCDETVETGSYNFSQAAARFNSENVLVLSNHPEIARAYLDNWNQVTALGECVSRPIRASRSIFNPCGKAIPQGSLRTNLVEQLCLKQLFLGPILSSSRRKRKR
ncbi:hypothetical protein LMG28614_06710 [Paraburkholderia ultramafica]|uniref:phospholipase D n=1 Tax=Paraburkholderia ultramafica TaxID=1544867 RepID=A0A6S7BPF5_9BURK|nr:phospholipase D-like domain-containing protein [Paraburkholderia ultramafica]CAB3807994.1 hypothetical protein LMG28614_06710 [Paraburkholderia ultramafica]